MVFGYQEKVDDLLAIQEQIERDVQALETCHYSIANFREILNKIQKGTTRNPPRVIDDFFCDGEIPLSIDIGGRNLCSFVREC